MTPADYDCEECSVSPSEDAQGVARRFRVTNRVTGGMRLVWLPKADGGRWKTEPKLLCSCLIENCLHRIVVREAMAREHQPTPPLAA